MLLRMGVGLRVLLRMIMRVVIMRAVMCVVMCVGVVRMIMIMMPMIMVPAMLGVGIGFGLKIRPAFGIKGGFHSADLPTKSFNHRLDHMVAADAKAAADDLHRQMPVTQMPCEAREFLLGLRADLAERLGRPDDLDKPPVRETRGIAGPKRDRRGKIEKEAQAAHRFEHDPPAVAVVVVQNDRIGRLFAPIAAGDDRRGSQQVPLPRVLMRSGSQGCHALNLRASPKRGAR